MRTTISLGTKVAALAEGVAKREKRNFSNLCEVALEAYCTPRAPSAASELITAAVIELGGEEKALPILIRAARRASKKEAA